jgi:hypothetical protein
MLTNVDRECLIETLAEHETYEVAIEDYIHYYTWHRDEMIENGDNVDGYPHPDTMRGIDLENFYYNDKYDFFSCQEDADLIEMAIESGCITSLEDFLNEKDE